MVHQKEIFKKIGAIIVEISEQYQYLSENPEQLNDLELELFSANADFLSEHVKILRRVNVGLPVASRLEATPESTKPIEKQAPVIEEKQAEISFKTDNVIDSNPIQAKPPVFSPENIGVQIPETPAYQPIKTVDEKEAESIETVVDSAPSPVFKAEESVPSRIYEEKAEEIIPNIAVAEGPIAVEVPPVKSNYTEAPVIERTISTPAPTLNDLISAQKTQTIQTNSQFSSGTSISDLKTSISLNDKLLFIKDLFNGYSLAYSEAIEILNRFESFDVADTFLKTNYANKNNWAAKQNAVEKFYDILRRRYSK